MCGPFLWGWTFWWIFPLVGVLMCVLMAFRFGRRGGGCLGINGPRAEKQDSEPAA